MTTEQLQRAALNLKKIAVGILIPLLLAVFFFALFSGSEEVGLLKNSPNALPWLLGLAFVLVGWRWPLVGGILINLAGMASIFFFRFYELENIWGFIIISVPLMVLGGLFILSWRISMQVKGMEKKTTQPPQQPLQE